MRPAISSETSDAGGEPELPSEELRAALEATRELMRSDGSYASNPIRANALVEWLPFVSRFGFEPWSASRHAF